MKKLVLAALLVYLPMNAHSATEEMICSKILAGGENLEVVPFVDQMIRAYTQLLDIPKYADENISSLRINPAAQAQQNDLRNIFRGNSANLDSASKEFRALFSTASVGRPTVVSAGSLRDRERNLNVDFLMFGRVIAQKNGIYLVALPADDILWDFADRFPMRFYYVMPSNASSNEGLAEFNAKLDVLALDVRKAVYGAKALIYRKNVLVMPNGEQEVFYAEEALELHRDDAIKEPKLAKLLSVFQ